MDRALSRCAVLLLLTVADSRGSQAVPKPTHPELPPPQERWINELPRFDGTKEHIKHLQVRYANEVRMPGLVTMRRSSHQNKLLVRTYVQPERDKNRHSIALPDDRVR